MKAYFDGSCEPTNPGGVMGWGVVIFHNNGKVLYETFNNRPAAPTNTNNVAEYLGLMAIFDWLEEQKLFNEYCIVHGDSRLVINQMFGSWNIKAGAYADVARQAKQRRQRFINMSGLWIPREQNMHCDALSRKYLRD